MNEALDKSSDHEILSGSKQVITNIQKLSKVYEKLIKFPLQLAIMEFIPTKHSLPQFSYLVAIANPHTSEICNLPAYICWSKSIIEVFIITKDTNGDRCFIGGDQILVKLKPVNLTVGKVRNNNDGTYAASFATDLVGETWWLACINSQQI